MKIAKKRNHSALPSILVNLIIIALTVASFLCAMLAVRLFSRKDCLIRIEEATQEAAQMFRLTLDERADKLSVLADLLSAKLADPDSERLLQDSMEQFCKTQAFSAVCIHRADGRVTSYGAHPHTVDGASFPTEAARLPYASDAFGGGERPEDNVIYQAVPIRQNGETVAILYGYTSLDHFPSFVSSEAYDRQCNFYIVDRDTGAFLMNERHNRLLTIYSPETGGWDAAKGYNISQLHRGIENGERGLYIFRSPENNQWYYLYYMPLGVNDWSMLISLNETTAFAAYADVRRTVLHLMVTVLCLVLVHVLVLMHQSSRINRHDRERLHKSHYINKVQRALMGAHNNPDFVDRALAIVGGEMKAETVLLLTFSGKLVTNTQYWPSHDRKQALEMVGRNIREDFPTLFDLLLKGDSVIYERETDALHLPKEAHERLDALGVSNMALVPITATSGELKGAIAAVNLVGEKSTAMLDCVTYDFFMAIANLEHHTLIKQMGEIDYLTGIKNRNSFESEIGSYTTLEAESLWCVFIDVNGLHEINNTYGHKAGDVMLRAVAEALKRSFEETRIWRMGGDEFLALVINGSRQSLLRKKKAVLAELAVRGYHVSIGFEGATPSENGVYDLDALISSAEEIMYREKCEFYERPQNAAQVIGTTPPPPHRPQR